MQTSIVELPSYFKGIGEIEKQLDKTNIKILTAMWKFGPRNLLEVSRRTGIPFTSVYHRVAKLEAKSGRIVYLLPETSKLGLIRIVVLVATKPGLEDAVKTALKIPKFWRIINKCEGTFTYLSSHAVPVEMLNDFKEYIQTLEDVGLITQFRLILTGDSIPTFPNFEYYNPDLMQWTFPWGTWLEQIKDCGPEIEVHDPEEYTNLADEKDMMIIDQLEENARKRLADLGKAPFMNSSLQVVKYHWDERLVPAGLVRCFAFDVYPYPAEVCSYHEVMLEFANPVAMNKFFSVARDLFFILTMEKVLNSNALLVLTYISNSQLSSMFTFFSELATNGILRSFSAVRLEFSARDTQSIPSELFTDQKGWVADFRKCTAELVTLVSQNTVTARIKNKTGNTFSDNLNDIGFSSSRNEQR
jgi:DNA-binding Lrp family transcriptional regulator